MNKSIKGFLKKTGSNAIFTSADDLNVTEEDWLKLKDKIAIQAKQFRKIEFYNNQFNEIKKLNKVIDNLIKKIKNNYNSSDFTTLSENIGKYCNLFLNYVSDLQRYIKKEKYDDMKKELISDLYDQYDEYKLAYQLGNFYKHKDSWIPIKTIKSDIYVDKRACLDSGFNFASKVKKLLKSETEFEIKNFLEVILNCVEYQMRGITKKIFFVGDLKSYYKDTDDLLKKFGIPCVFEDYGNNNLEYCNDDIKDLALKVTLIIIDSLH